MTKRSPEPPLSAINDLAERDSIWDALEGDPGWLVSRLRQGVASQLEQALAADLIDYTTKTTKSFPRIKRLAIARRATAMGNSDPHRQRKRIISSVAEHFKVSERYVYKSLKEFDDDALSQIDRINKNTIDGQPSAVTKKGPGGQTTTKFYGSPAAWLDQFAGPRRFWIPTAKQRHKIAVPSVRNKKSDNS